MIIKNRDNSPRRSWSYNVDNSGIEQRIAQQSVWDAARARADVDEHREAARLAEEESWLRSQRARSGRANGLA